jgi:hypothetical protein
VHSIVKTEESEKIVQHETLTSNHPNYSSPFHFRSCCAWNFCVSVDAVMFRVLHIVCRLNYHRSFSYFVVDVLWVCVNHECVIVGASLSIMKSFFSVSVDSYRFACRNRTIAGIAAEMGCRLRIVIELSHCNCRFHKHLMQTLLTIVGNIRESLSLSLSPLSLPLTRFITATLCTCHLISFHLPIDRISRFFDRKT